MKQLLQIVNRFAIDDEAVDIRALGDGLINDTYYVETQSNYSPNYVLQRVNTDVFKDPIALQNNINKVTECLHRLYGDDNRTVLKFVPLIDDCDRFIFIDNGGFAWRVSEYISDSVTIQTVTSQSAFDAGVAFGRFQVDLQPLSSELVETIPGFHDLRLRISQLNDAVEKDRVGRLCEVADMVSEINRDADAMTLGEQLYDKGLIPLRVCHCDTKVNNMLYDRATMHVLCVIDLDTVMPSLIYSDYGDFLRTAANATVEDDANVDNVAFRIDIFEAFTRGYLNSVNKFITKEELSTLAYGVARFPYMQAVRFLTDYINGDIYYKIQYPKHNLTRAVNQMQLYRIVNSMRPTLQQFIDSISRQ